MRQYIILLTFLIGNVLYGQGLETFEQLLTLDFTQSDSLDYEILEAEKDFLLKDKGLRFNSSAGTNDFGGIESSNIFRVRAGLEWNLLDEGFYDRKNKAQVLDIEKEILALEKAIVSKDVNYGYLYNYIIFCFNKSKLDILDDKLYLLEILIKRYEALYHAHGANYQDLIQLYNQAEEVILLKKVFTAFNEYYTTDFWKGLPNLIPDYLPILELNVTEIVDQVPSDSSIIELANLRYEKNTKEDKWVNQTRLSLYNNAYWRPFTSTTESNYIINNIGLRFSTNLSNRRNEKDILNGLETLKEINNSKVVNFNKEKELLNYILDYHAKLRTYTRFFYRLKSLKEDKRLDNAIRLVNNTTPQTSLKSLNLELDKLSTQYELIEIKQQLYLSLLKICHLSGIDKISQYAIEKEYEYGQFKLKGKRVIRINSENIDKYGSDFIKEYIVENEFRNIIITENSESLDTLLVELDQLGLQVFTEFETLQYDELIEVPLEQFKERISLEYWVNDHYSLNPDLLFYIEDLEKLLTIDSYSLEGK